VSTPTNWPKFDIAECITLYSQKRFDKLCEIIFGVIKHFNDQLYGGFGREDLKQLNTFVEFVFFLMTREDFRLPDVWIPLFTNINPIFANIVASTGYKTTDGVLKSVLYQQGNYAKILFLYTCRNEPIIPIQELIKLNPPLATIWWNNFSVAPPGSLSARVYENMQAHLMNFTPELILTDIRTQPIYFQCSYHGIDERPIKEWQNKQIQKLNAHVKIRCKPRKGRVAIITDKWVPTTAVYKSSYPQIAELAKKYDLTLVRSSRCHATEVDKTLFKRIIDIKFSPHGLDMSPLQTSDFELAYFPDVGMTDESVYMANLRLAPIMVCGYGHPVSTYGSRIDYFIGGLESECIELHEDNYSERLVLIPGIGAHPVDPKYQKKHPQSTEKFYINCCWTTSKINWPMLAMLQRIQSRASKPVHYQFYPSWTGVRYNCFPSLVEEMSRLFNQGVTVHGNLQYQPYLESMEKGSLTIDSYPFGGYNTIVDSLFVGCPVVTIEGTKFYNRASSALSRRVGIDLSTRSIADCEDCVLELIANPDKLMELRSRLDNEEYLRERLLHTNEQVYFVKAIDYLIENHPVPGTEPIIIQ